MLTVFIVATLHLLTLSSCQASSWPPLDSLQKEILDSDVHTTLSRLKTAIDAEMNPVLANMTQTWGKVCMDGQSNHILAREWPKKNKVKLQVIIEIRTNLACLCKEIKWSGLYIFKYNKL
jgi:hypothetical protein